MVKFRGQSLRFQSKNVTGLVGQPLVKVFLVVYATRRLLKVCSHGCRANVFEGNLAKLVVGLLLKFVTDCHDY